MLYNLAASSSFIAVAVNPVKVQTASLDIVLKLLYFYVYEALYSDVFCFVAFLSQCSIHTDAPYNRIGRIA
jgi:hypothetical protein